MWYCGPGTTPTRDECDYDHGTAYTGNWRRNGKWDTAPASVRSDPIRAATYYYNFSNATRETEFPVPPKQYE
ncbi:hypothetical protein ACLKA6_012553 [Drosophila palustris]